MGHYPPKAHVRLNVDWHVASSAIMYGGITPVWSLPIFYFTAGHALAHTPPHQGRWVPWAATVLARSQLLDGAGGPYFGSARGYDHSLPAPIKHIIKLIFGWDYHIFQKNFVFELQQTLLIFAFWPRQETDLRLLGAIKMLHTRPEPANWLQSWCTLPQIGFWKQNWERRGEREKKKKEREREEKARSGASRQPPIMARVLARAKRAIVFS